MKKRILALALVLILVLGALAGCGEKKEEPTQTTTPTQQSSQGGEKEPEKEPEPTGNFKPTTTSKAENALRIAVAGMYGTFDPNRCGLDTELWVVPAVYDSLCRGDGNGTILPGIATSWEVAEDGTYVIFTLRDDVYFHNGEHMTAEDVAYSALRCELSTQDSYVFDYTTCEAIDDTHVKFTFLYPDDAGFDALGEYIGQMAIMCKSWCEAISDDTQFDLGMQENGTGAYVLADVNQTTRDITLKKFDKYWGNVYIDTVYLKAITGDRELAFESGDIDYASYKYDNLGNVEGFDNVYVNTEISALQYYVTPNCAKPPFDDIRVRQALCYAMDREEVGMVACNGGGVVAWSMVSATLKDFRDVNEHLDNDPDKARQLMTEAGYSASNPAQVVMICRDWSLPVMEVLQERLEQCYFECHIEMVADSTRMWAGDFNLNCNQLILGSVQGYSALFDPDVFCTSHYADLDLAHRIQSAQTEEELIAVQKEMNDTLAYIAICQPANFIAIDSDLEIVAEGDENPYGGLDYTLRCLRWKN